MDDMIQFTITGVENVLEFIAKVYNEVLEGDEFWHFFNEEEEGIFLRCSEDFHLPLGKWLVENSYTYTREVYKEDNPIVSSFSWYFKRIFHLNAMMAKEFYLELFIKNEDTFKDHTQWQKDYVKSIWVGAITERLSHCFLNNLQEYTHRYKKQSNDRFGDDKAWESYVLAEIIIGRSMWTGMRKAYLDAKERKENNDTNQER